MLLPHSFKEKVFTGWFLIVGSLCSTVFIWLATLSSYDFILQDPFLFLSKAVVLPGTVGLCWAFILSTRFTVFEKLFNGLDKVYHVHKLIAILSFSLITLHPLFQFFRFVPDWDLAFGLFIPKNFGALEMGLFSFAAFLTLFALTLWVQIPYHIWKKTHEFFIVVLVLAFFHIVWMDKQVNASFLLSLWMYGFIFVALVSYLYIRFFYYYIGPHYQYAVAKIEKIRKTWSIYLIPATEKFMKYQPAQFIYVSFENQKLRHETHPFSVSSSPDQTLRLTIKKLGDYTADLESLKIGNKALIWGPYGRFYEKYLYQTDKTQVLIAGGIGVTPFLSMLSFEADHQINRKVYIFYSVENQKRADFHEEILSYTQKNPAIEYILWYSEGDNFLNADKIEEMVGTLKNSNFFLCGPFVMMKSFEKGLKEKSVKNKDIIFEDFNLLD